jgi:flagellar hook-associated protein 2
MAVSSLGSTNLDVNTIVSQLMTTEQTPLTNLAKTEASYQAQLSAYGSLNSTLSQFQSAVQALATPTRFQALTASVADASILGASASSSAIPGSYAIEVQTLAQQQKVNSTGFANTTDVVGSGTITIQYGTYNSGTNAFTLNSAKAAQSVVIDSAHTTLAGIRDAINAAGIAVSATIVNDGSANGNRLVLTSTDSGAANSLKISVADTDGNNTDLAGLSQLAYDPTLVAGAGKNLTQTLAAQDATLKVDGIAVTKPSNNITDAIAGVTLNLAKASVAGVPTTLTVAHDSNSLQAAVGAFVNAYNSVNRTIASLTAYNAQTQQGSVLTGDGSVLHIQSGMRAMLGTAIAGLSGNLRSLSDIGVAFQLDGSLALDPTKLQKAIDSNFGDIAKLFAAMGSPSDALVGYASASSATQPGTYAVSVTQLATQGTLAGTQAAGLTLTAGVNDALAVTIDGVAANVTLASAAPYASAAALAAELQSKINGAAAFASSGISVKVTAAPSGILSITSNRYGSASGVAVTAGAAHDNLFGATAPLASAAALDAAGSINGVAATGSGQFLTGATGNASQGLTLQINGGATGARGTVVYSQGYASQLAALAGQYLDPTNGAITSRTNGINTTLKDIANQRNEINLHLASIEARYRAQFTALDNMLSSMNTTSSFLTQQLASLPGAGK